MPGFQDRRRLACKKRNTGVKGSYSPQDRGRLACKRLYSTANERRLKSQAPFCLPCGKVQAGRPRSFPIFHYKKMSIIILNNVSILIKNFLCGLCG
ncbi:MAG: hypothetical protein LBP59_07490 [Planctomycetaceae bacterium]|nr:hypothetical protein [Planctomycetaceae bacterium]